MILHFFTVRLKEVDGRRAYDIRLRFRAGDDSIDFSASEPVLASFCFPLGPDSVSPKEFMASEVSGWSSLFMQHASNAYASSCGL